jgi:transcriptional regulator with XRE-family HTH domain
MSETDVGKRLRAAREQRGWSRETLAHHAGVSWAAISQIESGRRRDVRLATLAALAQALNISIDHLAGGRARQGLKHSALFYDSAASFASAAASFLSAGLRRGEALFAVTSRRNLKSLKEALGSDASQVRFEDSSAWYSDPPATLASYSAFVDDRVEAGFERVRIVGEPVWTDLSSADRARWMRYESLINLVFETRPLSLMCPYNTRALSPGILKGAGETHPGLVEEGRDKASRSFKDPAEFIVG